MAAEEAASLLRAFIAGAHRRGLLDGDAAFFYLACCRSADWVSCAAAEVGDVVAANTVGPPRHISFASIRGALTPVARTSAVNMLREYAERHPSAAEKCDELAGQLLN